MLLLLLTCLFNCAMVICEAPWQNSLINLQHFVNEVFFYVLITGLIIFSGVVTDTHDLIKIGWLMIALCCLFIVFNLTVIILDMLRFYKLLLKRYRHILLLCKAKCLRVASRVKSKVLKCCQSMTEKCSKCK